ncbi:MAG: hypothetical protein K1Y02_23160 [Candidatus Hydrogenedentes bacterium]|nr:hypothetical protein [Candidatus Hydrogenedentota bacterium]
MLPFVVSFALILSAAATPDFEVVGDNLAANPGFEDADANGAPTGWGAASDVYTRDTATFHSGGASLKYVNDNADRYLLCSRGIPLKPGKMYELSFWVKTQGVDGDDSGATVCLEWHGKNGKYLGGFYPDGRKGDTDWTQVTAISPRISEDATGISINCYLRKDMKGTAWWDDISVREVRERPLSVVMLYPNYRGELTDAGLADARFSAFFNLSDYGLLPKDVELRWRATCDASGEEAASGNANPTSNSLEISIPKASFKEGLHHVTASLYSKATGECLDEESLALTRLTGSSQRVCTIDEYNRLIVNGQPFFPLGMYWGGIDAEQLDIYADSPFNCLLPYAQPDQAQLDLAHAKNLKVIYTVKDTYFGATYCPSDIKSVDDEFPSIKAKVDAYKNHPAVLAWYINDELSLEYKDRLVAHNEYIRSLDPDHPTYAVLFQFDQIRDYMPTFDVIGTDPYPIARISASRAAEYTRATRKGSCYARPVWQVPQVFSWANYSKSETPKPEDRMPTFDEMRSMAWQCIAEGANGLIFYSWFDIRRDKTTPFEEHWPKVKAIAAEIRDMIPVLLSVEPAPRIETAPNEDICWRAQQLGDTTTLIVVNATEKPATTQFKLPKPPNTLVVRTTGENVTGTTQTFDVALAPLEVRIYEMTGLK